MDHHCIWINNCIGILNQKNFILFLFYAAIYSFWIFVIVFTGALIFVQRKGIHVDYFNFTKLYFLILAGFSIFFLLFIIDFLWEQIIGIIENQTVVESRKIFFGKPVYSIFNQGSFIDNAKHIFGENYFTWLLPIKSNVISNYCEGLYTYEELMKFSVFPDDSQKYQSYALLYKVKQ